MKNKKYIILGILIVFTILFMHVFFYPEKEKKIIVGQNKIEVENNYVYSRVNFFLTKNNKASLNIPEYWEGNYRIKDAGNKVDFVFLKEGKESGTIFSIELLDSGKTVDDDKKILFKNDKYYYLLENKNNINDKDFIKMNNDLDSILKSFKVSK